MAKIEKRRELGKAGVKLPSKAVERDIKKEILPWLNREEIIVITGARQTGKSVLMSQLIYGHLLAKTKHLYYFNLDVPSHRQYFENPDYLIQLAAKTKAKTYVFIDEVQRLKEPGLFLKGIYDLHLPIKLVVSGSSALEIKSKVHEALTGRKKLFHLNPFNLKELASALFPTKDFNQILSDKDAFKEVLGHYFIYGGYPAVAMARGHRLKLQLLEENFLSYIEKDIKDFLKIENETAFRNLIKILASQIGNLVNKDELSISLGIHKNTLENYLFYLEQTFLIDFVRPFFKNPRKELLKNPKVYFRDLGLRNLAIGGFNDFNFRPDRGALFENFAYLCLKEKLPAFAPLNFWRTKAGAEVDFVMVPRIDPIPFEVKAVDLQGFRVGRSFRSFLKAYKPRDAYHLNLSLCGERTIEGVKVKFLNPEEMVRLKI